MESNGSRSPAQVHAGRFGPIEVRIHGDGPFRPLVAKELGATPGDATHPLLDLSVQRDPPGPPTGTSVAKGALCFDADAFYRRGTTAYRVDGLFSENGAVRAAVHDPPLRGASRRDEVRRWLHGIPTGKFALASYEILWPLVDQALAKVQAGFLHAGAVERDEKALVLAGSGGCGKTSTVFRLLEDAETRYLSEDFTILGAGGRIHPCPKSVSIYHTDLPGQKVLQDAMRRLSRVLAIRRWYTRTIRKGNPPLKIAPEALLGPRMGRPSKAIAVVFLVRRATLQAPVLTDRDPEEVAARAQAVAAKEFRSVGELLRQIEANRQGDEHFPTEREWLRRLTERKERSLAGTPCHLLELPLAAGPDAILATLEDHGIWSR